MPRQRPEDSLQIDAMEFLRLTFRNLIIYHTPNESKSNPITGAINKRKGVLAGVPDITILVPDSAPWFIELKIRPNKQTAAQVAFELGSRLLGCRYHLCYSLSDVTEVARQIEEFLASR